MKKFSTSQPAKLYPARDAHEAFFRPGNKSKPKPKPKRKSKKRKRKARPLTNKQRQAWAKAHYLANHGTKTNADVKVSKANKLTTAEALCAVFDSSDEHEEEDSEEEEDEEEEEEDDEEEEAGTEDEDE